MTITHLVTHNGGFHADELLSSVILPRLYPQAEVVRTRDAAWIAPGEGKIIYDVGRDYDANPRDNDWSIGGIRISGDSFEQRADLPAAWAGLGPNHDTGLARSAQTGSMRRVMPGSWIRKVTWFT